MVRESEEFVTKDFLRAELSELEQRVDARFARVDARFAQVEQRIEIGFAQVDARFAQVDARFAAVDTKFAQLEQRLTAKIEGVDKKLTGQIADLAVQTAQGFTAVANDFRRQQSWMIGTVISAGVLLVAVLGLLVKLAFFS